MNFMQMSFYGTIMILAIIIVRKLGLNKLPKKTFVLLWGIVLVRLLIPFSIPSTFSVYSFLNHFNQGKTFEKIEEIKELVKEEVNTLPNFLSQDNKNDTLEEDLFEINYNASIDEGNDIGHINWIITEKTNTSIKIDISMIDVLYVIWIIGMIACLTFFFVAYIRCYLEFQTSLPVENEFVENWLKEHTLKRKIQIRQSSKIKSPLTYAILKPVILLPKNTDWEDTQQLNYVLLHEFVHITHYDIVWKLIAILALAFHWFNPIVWLMYTLLNRDIEFSCDEVVIQKIGQNARASYARTLIHMEEQKSKVTLVCNNFNENVIEERIKAIMKMKKMTTFMGMASIVVLIAIALLFATSNKSNAQEERPSGTSVIVNKGANSSVIYYYESLQKEPYGMIEVSEDAFPTIVTSRAKMAMGEILDRYTYGCI